MSNYCSYITKGLRLEFSKGPNNELYYRTRPCCHMHGDKFCNSLKQWEICNNWQDLEQHKNRHYFLDWQNNNSVLHEACYPCKKIENYTPENSPRFLYKDNKEIDYHILDVVVGNTCNMACPFCAPNVSSLIEKITSHYDRTQLPGKWGNNPQINANPFDVAKVVSDFICNRKVGELKIIGGEPLLAENWNEIGKVIDKGMCEDMTITFTTNGSIMNEKIIKNLYKVKRSKVTVSIDSIGENYNFIRWPYNWNKVKDNLDYLIQNKPDSAWVNVDGLISVINFELLPDIIEEFEKWPSYSFMFDLKPEGSELDFKVLSKEIMHDVYKKIQRSDIKKNIEYVLDNYYDVNLTAKKEKTKKSLQWFLQHRQMDKSVLGPKTIEYLAL